MLLDCPSMFFNNVVWRIKRTEIETLKEHNKILEIKNEELQKY